MSKIKNKKKTKSVAEDYNGIASSYYNKGECTKALENYFKALMEIENAFNKEYEQIISSINQTSSMHEAKCAYKGEYDNTLICFLDALEIKETLLGKEHSYLVPTYQNLSIIYMIKGDYYKALGYIFKALEIMMKSIDLEEFD